MYTLIFTKPGYARVFRRNVVVDAGIPRDLDVEMEPEFTEMQPFQVQDLLIGGTDAALLQLRTEAPQLIDSIGSDLLSQAGASDAADAINLIAGATVQDGKFAVVRGLPDRFVNSQINGVRLPTADEDKRAVQLDQFPSAIIESVQVSKTFTPDQQGDASGGAVNVILKGIPEETIFEFKAQVGYNDQVSDRDDFLTYRGGGVNFWGNDRGGRDAPADPADFEGAAGVSRGETPDMYKWSLSGGGKIDLADGLRVGGFVSFFYERDASFYDNGIDDSYWVTEPGEGLVPETNQGTPEDGDFKTALFDVEKGTELVQWGGLGTFGLETENHNVNLTYLYTRVAEDEATLAEDTRGKEYFFPDTTPTTSTARAISRVTSTPPRTCAPRRSSTPSAPPRRSSSHGEHTLPIEEFGWEDVFMFQAPVIDWTYAQSSATLYQPDKRQFGQLFTPESLNPGFPPFVPPFIVPSEWGQYKPAAVFTLGNFQRIYKEIEEDSEQYQINLTLPFEQWTGTEGSIKFGVFDDQLVRTFNQDTFSNFNDAGASFEGDFEDFWSLVFPFQGSTISDGPPFVDVDYRGDQSIEAFYAMADLPLSDDFRLIGGARIESTEIGIVNFPEENATWFPPGAISPVTLNPGDADVLFTQEDLLPSIGFAWDIRDDLTLRGAYSETVARQTFKELTPIQQQEFLGGDIFIGNPELEMAALRNYDLRLDYRPFEGGLFSVSYFRKYIQNPIETVQRVAGFTFTTPVNYPEGDLRGFELEARQKMGEIWEPLTGLELGANATFIDSQVTLTDEEIATFSSPSVLAPIRTRDMTNAPEYLYNLFLTYDLEPTGTSFALFYTVKGDTLIAGAGESDGNFIPSVYETELGSLNFSLTQKIGDYVSVRFQAKNLTNPAVETVYRSQYIGDDVVKTSFTRGVDYSLSVSAKFTF